MMRCEAALELDTFGGIEVVAVRFHVPGEVSDWERQWQYAIRSATKRLLVANQERITKGIGT